MKIKIKSLKKYAKAHFTYNYEKNHYTCPQKQILPYKNTYTKNNKAKKKFTIQINVKKMPNEI
jgi:hypothetical protein